MPRQKTAKLAQEQKFPSGNKDEKSSAKALQNEKKNQNDLELIKKFKSFSPS